MDRFKANDIAWMTALQSGKFYFCIYIYSHVVMRYYHKNEQTVNK